MFLNQIFNEEKTKAKNFYALVFFMFILVGVGIICYKFFFKIDRQTELREIEKHSLITRLSEKEMALIEEGDIILRRGYGFFSNYIAEYYNDLPYDVTHAGIIVKKDNELAVVHSLASDVSDIDGVQMDLLVNFLKASHPGKIMVMRIKNKNFSERKK